MSFRRIRAVARKEFLHILRDVRSLILALALPVLMLLLFGYALTLDVDRIPTMIYDADKSPESRELIAKFTSSRYFSVAGYTDNYRQIERAIDDSRILMGIVIDRDYAKNLNGNNPADVQLLLDGSDSNTASIALGYAQAVLRGHSLDLRKAAILRSAGFNLKTPIDVRLRVWYNSELKSKNYIVPGLIAIIMVVISALISSLTIAREWEMGTMEQLLSTPLRPAEMVLGKMTAFLALGAIDTVISIAAATLVFQVPMRGNLFFLGVSSGLFLVGALCWGVLISAVARSQLLAYQIAMLSSFLPAFLLSGFVYSIDNMPQVIQVISRVVLARYFVTIVKAVFLKGVGLEVLWLEVVFLTLYALIVFILTTRKVGEKVA